MRATMGTIHRNMLNNLGRITERLNLLNTQITSGKQMSRLSDDPVNLAGALGLRTTHEEIRQYQRNLLFGDHFIRSSESALRQINELTVRAKELAIQAASDILTPEDPANLAEEARNLFEQAVVLANTQVNGKFIFGGFRTSGYTETEPAPFLVGWDNTYRVNGSTPEDLPLGAGDLRINGIAVGAAADNSAGAKTEAINAVAEQTGVQAKVNPDGTLQLYSVRPFILESATVPPEQGLAAIGLAGGGFQTDDAAGDGILNLHEIARREGSVRYVGDPDNDLEIKVGARSTLTVSKNGREALMDTGVFSVLKRLEDYLRGQNYTGFRSAVPAADTAVTLAAGGTGLAEEGRIIPGQFTVTITDHEQDPPVDFTASIDVDPDNDTLEDIASRMDSLPGLSAAWDAEGYLNVEVTDKERYSVALADDSSNFLQAAGLAAGNIQFEALEQVIAELGPLMDKLTNQISDFGARGNRIDAQGQILSNLELAVAENLSAKEDTDMVKAFMDLKAKEVAYQSALSAAAKTMQLSLVDFLR